MISWDKWTILNCSLLSWCHFCQLLGSQTFQKLKNCKCLSVAYFSICLVFVLLFYWYRRQHFLCDSSLFFFPHPLHRVMKSAGMGHAAQLQAASHGPAGSYRQGCNYYTLFYRKHCFAGNIFHFQQSGSSGSMRCNIFQRKPFSFLSSILILANKARELVPKWSLQAERRGTAFTIWNWSILSVLVSKCIKEKKKKKIKKV